MEATQHLSGVVPRLRHFQPYRRLFKSASPLDNAKQAARLGKQIQGQDRPPFFSPRLKAVRAEKRSTHPRLTLAPASQKVPFRAQQSPVDRVRQIAKQSLKKIESLAEYERTLSALVEGADIFTATMVQRLGVEKAAIPEAHRLVSDYGKHIQAVNALIEARKPFLEASGESDLTPALLVEAAESDCLRQAWHDLVENWKRQCGQLSRQVSDLTEALRKAEAVDDVSPPTSAEKEAN